MGNPVSLPNDLRGLILSATEIYHLTGWPDAMIEDYLTLLENLLIFSDAINGKQNLLRTVTRVEFSDSPYTIQSTDEEVIFDTDNGDIVANLPEGEEGRKYRMTSVGSSGNKVSLFPDGAELLFGTTTENIYDAETLITTYGIPDGWW